MSRVFVVGSINLDEVFQVPRIARPGETVASTKLTVHSGGKGANQAVAAARAGGAETRFIGCVGDDEAGQVLSRALRMEGVDSRLRKDEHAPTGRAVVTVQDNGENSITILPAANYALDTDDVADACSDLQPGDVLLLQLEIPSETAEAAIGIGQKTGCTVILNASPVDNPVSLEGVSLLVVNEHECTTLAGVEDALEAAAVLAARHGLATVVTMGAEGGAIVDRSGAERFSAVPVDAVDTTGAGDTFAGYLAAALASGEDLGEAIVRASVAGSIAVTRPGAMESIPRAGEVTEAMARRADLSK